MGEIAISWKMGDCRYFAANSNEIHSSTNESHEGGE